MIDSSISYTDSNGIIVGDALAVEGAALPSQPAMRAQPCNVEKLLGDIATNEDDFNYLN